jgi:putative ABC transport system permease protein
MIKFHLVFWYRSISRQLFGNILGIFCLLLGIAPSLFIYTWLLNESSYDRFHAKSKDIYRITIETVDEETGSSVHFARSWFGWLKEIKNEMPGVRNIARLTHQHGSILEVNKDVHEINLFYTDNSIFKIFDFDFIKGNPSQALLKPGSVVITMSTAKKYFGERDPLGETLKLSCRNCKDHKLYTVTGIVRDYPPTSHFHFNMLLSYDDPQAYPGWAYYYLLLDPGIEPSKILENFHEFAKNYYTEERLKNIVPHLQNIENIHLFSDKAREIERNGSIGHVIIIGILGLFVLIASIFNFVNINYFSFLRQAKSVQLKRLHGAVKRDIFIEKTFSVFFPVLVATVLSLILFFELWPSFNKVMKNISLSNTHFLMEIIFFTIVIFIIIVSSGLIPLFINPKLFVPGNILSKSPYPNRIVRKSWLNKSIILVILQYAFCMFFLIVMLISRQQVNLLLTESIPRTANRVMSIQDLPSQVINKYQVYKNLLLEHPAIIDVTSSMETPGDESMDRMDFTITGLQANTDNQLLWVYPVDVNYFDFHDHQILAGNDFPEVFPPDTVPERYILNESAVKMLGLPPLEAVGKDFSLKLNIQGENIFRGGEIIGVVEDFQMASSKNEIKPFVFFPKSFWLFDVQVKIQGGKEQEAIAHARETWQKIYHGFPFQYEFVEDIYSSIYESEIQLKDISLLLGIISILLALLGLIGVSQIHFQAKVKEIGIRKVLGAKAAQVASMILARYLVMVLSSALLAIPVAYLLMGNWLQNFANPVQISVATFLIPFVFTLLLALAIILLQVIKAARNNPVQSLRD